MLFALPLFALLAWWAGRGKPALTRRDWLVVSGLGFSGYYLASFLDFAGLAYITREPRAADPLPQPDAGAGARRCCCLKRKVTRAPADRARRQLLRRAAGVRPRGVACRARTSALGAGAGVRQRGRATRSTWSLQRRGGQAGSARCASTGLATSVACLPAASSSSCLLRPLVGAGRRAAGDLAVGAERDRLHLRAGADGDDGDRAHRRAARRRADPA